MNCFSASRAISHRILPLFLLALVAACGMSGSASADRDGSQEYAVHYQLVPNPGESSLHVTMRVRQPQGLLRELSFPASGTQDLSGHGEIVTDGGTVRWFPPSRGGTLEWHAKVHNRRSDDLYDAYLGPDWGLFRIEDVIPRARTRTLKGANSRTTFEFLLPAGWSVVSEYSAIDSPVLVDRAERRFDQPTGWVVMGGLGVRRETIAGTRVAIAGPEGHDVRRMDMLALLNWTLPELNAILPDALPRLTVISAGEPMWRGGLSAPASLFLHADRPLISENATSSLLHEVMHVALGIRAADNYDWIVEGLAEYYSIELLRRGHAITTSRAIKAFEWQADWAEQAETLCGEHSTAATTALAVNVFVALDSELRVRSESGAGLDELLPMIARQEIDLETLTAAATEVMSATPDTLHIEQLPGCHSIP